MKHFLLLGLFAIAVGAVSASTISCSEVRGSGKIISEKRTLSDFSGIEAGGAVELEVIQSNGYSVEIETDDNIMPFVQTAVESGVLRIWTKDHTEIGQTTIRVKVQLPKLELLDLSGASQGIAKAVNTDKLHLKVSGASELTLSGKADNLEVKASGASKLLLQGRATEVTCEVSGASSLKAKELIADKVKIDCSGASKSHIFANNSLSIDASGASDVLYSGPAKEVLKETSGASSISQE